MYLFENLGKIFEKNVEDNFKMKGNKNLTQEEFALAQKLDAIEEFTVDRFEDDMVILEERKTRRTTAIRKNKLPRNIKTGDILKKINGKFIIEIEKTKAVEKRIEKKMDNLWK